MLKIINENWNWLNINFIKIIDENDFGNLILMNEDLTIWRICPEELQCKKIADNINQFIKLQNNDDFIEDWNLNYLNEIAIKKLGKLNRNEKFTLIKPGVLGGEYIEENLVKMHLEKLIKFAADLAFQIKDLKDGQKITINIKNYT